MEIQVLKGKTAVFYILLLILGVIAGFLSSYNLLFLAAAAGFLGFTVLLICLRVCYDAVVYLAIVLLSVVLIEPAPSDLLFLLLLFFGLVHQKLQISRIRQNRFVILGLVFYTFFDSITLTGAFHYADSVRFYLITTYLLLFALFILVYASEQTSLPLLKAYVVSSTFSVVLGFAGYMGFFSSVLMYYGIRMKSLFKDPNVFGPFLIPSIILLLNDRWDKSIVKNGLLRILLIILHIAGVVMSFSRAAWISLLMAGFIFVVLNWKRFNWLKIGGWLILVAVFLVLLWNWVLDPRLKDFILERSRLQGYDTMRFASQQSGLYMASENLFGYGPGQYELSVKKVMGVEFSAHNLYIKVLLENGILGFLSFFGVMAYTMIKLLLMHWRKGTVPAIDCSVLFSILGGIAVNSLVIDTLHWRHFWFFLGLSFYAISSRSTGAGVQT